MVDARAKITWGEDPVKVMDFLQLKRVSEDDALALLRELLQERNGAIRGIGLKKLLIGVPCAAAPVVFYYWNISRGRIHPTLMAGFLVIGAFGLHKITGGLSMILRPRASKVDLSAADA